MVGGSNKKLAPPPGLGAGDWLGGTGLIEGGVAEGYRHGKNSKLSTGFTPAAPPPGHGPHHYHFQVFALDVALIDPPGIGRGSLVDRMKGHVLAWGEIVGVYERR